MLACTRSLISLLVFPGVIIGCAQIGKDDSPQEAREMTRKERILSGTLEANILASGSFYLDDTSPIYDEEGKRVFLSELVNGTGSLVLRFSPSNCIDCILAEMENINYAMSGSIEDDVVFLSSFQNINQLRIFKRDHNIPYALYNTSEFENDLPRYLEDLHVPYYFIADTTRLCDNLYVPEKELASMSTFYLKEVAEKLKREKEKGIVFKNTMIEQDGSSGKPLSFVFSYRNEMDIPLIIKDVRASCNCTAVSYDKHPIQPGERAEIQIEYNSDIEGYYFKKIIVESNSPKGKVLLTIKGNLT
ncbi:DUF1573 domain-containing protein [Parapedobacter tibetensis]|uniref:DUF1573 domain-containing protein n=1 Tax=Parapedobacter tibetensis TaxID=2972951 RepID=UPI00214DE0BC|nr:DUF1573 domain-containing protein [Parapedobacter tibetensis]